MEYNDEEDRKFFDALRDKDYPQAIYHLSPRLYRMYLQASDVSPEEREAFEAQQRIELAKTFGFKPETDKALALLERWYGFGEFREISPSADSYRALTLASLDAQQVAIVRKILTSPAMSIQDKVEAAIRVARIQPDSTMGWGECQALAQFFEPYNLDFQPEMDEWCSEMYASFKRSALGGTR